MRFREATIEDIAQMQVVRHAVKENTLSDPNLVPDAAVAFYITEKGKGWVCEINGTIVGFAIVDLLENSIWALFVNPEFDRKGIGKKLHQLMLDWYFSKTKQTVSLGTSPETRAEEFYKRQGWTAAGHYPNGEVKFEMACETWIKIHNNEN